VCATKNESNKRRLFILYIYMLSTECGPLLTGNNRVIRHFNGASDGFFGNSLTYNIQYNKYRMIHQVYSSHFLFLIMNLFKF